MSGEPGRVFEKCHPGDDAPEEDTPPATPEPAYDLKEVEKEDGNE